MSVLRRDNIEVAGRKYPTYVVQEKWDSGEVTRWELESGEVIRQELPQEHLTFVRETKAEALKFGSTIPPDISKL